MWAIAYQNYCEHARFKNIIQELIGIVAYMASFYLLDTLVGDTPSSSLIQLQMMWFIYSNDYNLKAANNAYSYSLPYRWYEIWLGNYLFVLRGVVEVLAVGLIISASGIQVVTVPIIVALIVMSGLQSYIYVSIRLVPTLRNGVKQTIVYASQLSFLVAAYFITGGRNLKASFLGVILFVALPIITVHGLSYRLRPKKRLEEEII